MKHETTSLLLKSARWRCLPAACPLQLRTFEKRDMPNIHSYYRSRFNRLDHMIYVYIRNVIELKHLCYQQSHFILLPASKIRYLKIWHSKLWCNRLIFATRGLGLYLMCGQCRLLIVPPEVLQESQNPPGFTEVFGDQPSHSKVFRPVGNHVGAF